MNIPTNIQTIRKRIDMLGFDASTEENKNLASDLQQSLNDSFKPAESLLNSMDFESNDWLPLNNNFICDQLGDFSGIITDGGDSYYQIALQLGKEAFNQLSEKMSEFSFESLASENDNLIPIVLDNSKPLVKNILKDNNLDYIDTDNLIDNIKDNSSDISNLAAQADSTISNIRKSFLNIIKSIMEVATDKTMNYDQIASTFVTKMENLKDNVGSTIAGNLTCSDIIDIVVNNSNIDIKEYIQNSSLQNSLINNYNISPDIVNNLSINDSNQISNLLKNQGINIEDKLGNTQLNKINGFVSSQEASKIAKAISDNMITVNEEINNDIEKQKIINTSKNINKDIDYANDFLGGV